MRKMIFYPEGIRRMIRREKSRIRRAHERRNGGGGDLFANPDYYAREEMMARLHLEMLKGVLARTLDKEVADLTPEDWEIAGGSPALAGATGFINLENYHVPIDQDAAAKIFHCNTKVQAKG